MYYLGFDIGGSSVKAALVKDKKINKSKIHDTPKSLEELLDLLGKIKEELMAGIEASEIGGIGILLPGPIDKDRQNVLNVPNLAFLNGQPIKKLLEEKFMPCPVKIEHDVHCFLLAEKEIGLAKDLKNVFYLTLGTGVGGAFMINGEIISGAHGSAGEAGHHIIEASQGLDFENLASNKFIVKTLGIGSIEAAKRAGAGDQKAKEALEKLGQNLGVGIANIINIFDPEAIILAGGIAESKEFILNGIKEGIEKFVISPAAKETQILFSELGRFGGALGAALLFDTKQDL